MTPPASSWRARSWTTCCRPPPKCRASMCSSPRTRRRPLNPLGVKGAGEGGTAAAGAVIANAVSDALGRRGAAPAALAPGCARARRAGSAEHEAGRLRVRRADSVEQALALLAEHADDVKVLAGGQSLMPMLNFRLARPGRLVDINGLGALASVRRADGKLHIGALTRQAVMERSAAVRAHWPLLHEALAFVAHPQIRNRGTIGGSVAHADPAAELPVALTALDASVTVASRRGSRSIAMSDLYITHLTTCLEADELLTEIIVPPISPAAGSAFVEYARRHGDFGLGGAAVILTPGSDGRCEQASIVLLAAAPTPLRAHEAERGPRVAGDRRGQSPREAAACAVREIAPTGDIHGDTRYRRRLIEALVRRAVLTAADRAGLRRTDG